MKKIICFITMICLLLCPMNAYAAESQQGSIPITYEVEGNFMLSIPSSISVGEDFQISVCEYNIASDECLKVTMSNINSEGYIRLYNSEDIANGVSESNASYVDITVYTDINQISYGNTTLGYFYCQNDTINVNTTYVKSSDGRAGEYSGVIEFSVDCVSQ